MNTKIENIVIVGGGSAGWLSAGILAAEFQTDVESPISITLVESPDVSPIGVGEGTWPTMRTSLQRIGISETEFVRECAASFKQGSQFVGWNTEDRKDVYFHPFTLPAGYGQANLYQAWQNNFSHLPFSSAVCAQTQICESGFAPKLHTMPEYAGALNYAYHLDAGKFSTLLQKHCTEKLGVKHILDHVCGVNASVGGTIESLQTKASGKIEGQLFIDCTGTASLLLGEHFKIPFKDLSKYSPNDSAIAAQVAYASENAPIASATIASAQSAGWTWDIGLSTRRGTGYVYSSAHIDDDSAEKELRAYLALSIGESEAEKIISRKIAIKAGHREKFWHNNCVAIGMSAGFIEPLEASALALVELSANMIRDELPICSGDMDILEKRFNTVFHYRWEKIVDFLKLHYILSDRRDTPYWCDITSAESIPDSLQELMRLWQHRPPGLNDIAHLEEIFPPASYQYILYGMGFKHKAKPYSRASDNSGLAQKKLQDNSKNKENYQRHLPGNRELINNIVKYGMQKI